MTLTATLAHIDADQSNSLARLKALLGFPSISTDPAYAADCLQTADWLVEDLQSIGLAAKSHPTQGHPIVLAHHEGPGPHLLFYGHYDVQPVDPIDLWDHLPFEPFVDETAVPPCIRGRGASDDKGQLMTFIEAMRAWKTVSGSLPCKVTVLLEGEEESGSPSLVPFLQAHKTELGSCDVAMICDTGLFGQDRPAITTMLRGLLAEEIVIQGPCIDLHSGSYGGIAMNPARVLTKILGQLHDTEGRVQIPGFYDAIPEVPDNVAQQWDHLGFSDMEYLGAVKLSKPAGEADRSGLEMIWSRPTAEINGISTGYTGEGFKTVLPAQATAKVSFRLVAGQEPLRLRRLFRDWVRAQVPEDCSVTFIDHGAGPASTMDHSHPAFEATRQALSEEWGKEAAFIGSGGSIPIAGYFQTILGIESVLAGFARDNDAIHSPNEKYDVECFHKGIRSWARTLEAVGNMNVV